MLNLDLSLNFDPLHNFVWIVVCRVCGDAQVRINVTPIQGGVLTQTMAWLLYIWGFFVHDIVIICE